MKDQRDRETRNNAEELLRYLEFDDIKDFSKVTCKDFEEINFISDCESENLTENESLCCEMEDKYDFDIPKLLLG
jgi:hypothetical protein